MQRDRDRDNRGRRFEGGSQARGEQRYPGQSRDEPGGRRQEYGRQDQERRGRFDEADQDFAYERDREAYAGQRSPAEYFPDESRQRSPRDEWKWPKRGSSGAFESGAEYAGYGPGYGASGGGGDRGSAYGDYGGGFGDYSGYGPGGPGYGAYGAEDRYGGQRFGGAPQGRDDDRRRGQEHERYGGSRADEHHQDHYDPDYHQWRAEQIRSLDEAYRRYRQERYRKFADEFEQWRRTREQAQDESGSEVSGGSSIGAGSGRDTTGKSSGAK